MNARQTFLHYLHFSLLRFKIKPEDFHNVSASRNEGSSLTSNEAGSISDAKVAKFFGINKKTPQKIAVKRHAKRDAAKIQQAWNARRIANIEESVKNGLLSKECLTGLSALKQEELNARISFLQKTAARHAAQTPQEIAAIKQRWVEKQLSDNTIRTRAQNILTEAKKWSEVDYSALEKFVAAGDLTKMRDESMSVIKAIRAMCDKEKALADLIPEVHGWYNTFSVAELREAHGKIQSTLDYWKVKGYDLATDSNLHTFMAEVEQKSNSWRTPEHSKPDSKRTRHGKFSRTHIANYSTKD